MTQEREGWRHQAEVECLKSGSVKISPSVAQAQPIAGPGMCGADFPLKVAALGEGTAFGFADEGRPPPVSERALGSQMRWMAGPEPVRIAPSSDASRGGPLQITPPGVADQVEDDIPDDAQMPAGRYGAPATRPAVMPPREMRPDAQDGARSAREPYAPPPLGPQRSHMSGAIQPAIVTPAATLACPIVAALDQWMAAAVQPAAMRWFGQPVAEIKQISAYSCRGMNGQAGARISEHAFGNALDIAAFVLADGNRITVKGGWQGTPEEQGFLRDVQGAACQQFSTVLAPGSNRFHYDHIHVDLMRRASGRRICQPGAVDGEVVARAAARNRLAHGRDPASTGSISSRLTKAIKNAIAGEDDLFEDEDDAEEKTRAK